MMNPGAQRVSCGGVLIVAVGGEAVREREVDVADGEEIEFLTRGKVRSDRRDDMDHYRNLTACLTCGLKPECTTDKVKRQKRWQHEAVLDRMQARVDRMPEAMTIRRQTVEHPFGTLKAWMGSTHFLTRTLEKVKTEMSLQVLAYNIRRMLNIFGIKPLMEAIAD